MAQISILWAEIKIFLWTLIITVFCAEISILCTQTSCMCAQISISFPTGSFVNTKMLNCGHKMVIKVFICGHEILNCAHKCSFEFTKYQLATNHWFQVTICFLFWMSWPIHYHQAMITKKQNRTSEDFVSTAAWLALCLKRQIYSGKEEKCKSIGLDRWPVRHPLRFLHEQLI